jgi:hypothetical protein
VDPADLHVGDVITYQAPVPGHPTVTHRVVEILEPGPHPLLRTRGDANQSPDPWTARLTGAPAWRRVAVVPQAGTVIRILRSTPVHHATVHIVPVVLLAAMLMAIWRPRRHRLGSSPRVAKGRAVAVAAVIFLAAGAPGAVATFTRTGTASNTITADPDWTAPTIDRTVIAKSTTGYLGGSVKQGGTYYVYANVTDTGNPASGMGTVKTDESALTTGQTNVSLTSASGPWSVQGQSYNFRTALQTATTPLVAGAKTYSITPTDSDSNTQTVPGYPVTVDNSGPTAIDIQTTNHAGGTVGTAEIGDTIIYTFSEQIDPQSILAGWTGGSSNVIVHLQDGGCTLIFCAADSFVVYSGVSQLSTLGVVSLADSGYTGGSLLGSAPDTIYGATGTASTMLQSGATITITLGTRSGSAADNGGSTLMSWNSDIAPFDAAGNAASGNLRSETGSNNKEF